jgi:hypothetical protein
MSTARGSLAWATDPNTGQLYAIGGLKGTTAQATAEKYDPSSDTWSAIAPLPQAVYAATAVYDGEGHIFVIGGDNSAGHPVSSVYRYTILTDSWDTMSAMPFAASAVGAAYSAYGQIYVAGGHTTSGATAAVEWYDPVLDQWSVETPLPAPVYGAAVAVDDAGNVDVIGGFNSSGKAVSSFYTSPVGPAPTGLPATPTVSFDTTWQYYNGQPVVVTPTAYGPDGVTPVDGTFTLTYNGSSTPPTNAGTYNLLAIFTSADPGYVNAIAVGTLYIGQVTPTLSLTGGGTITYNGQPHAVVGTAVGLDGVTPLSGTWSYTYGGQSAAPVNAGTYAVVATFTPDDANYAVATATTTIAIPNPTIPTGLVGSGASETAITISWDPIVAVPVAGYNVYKRNVLHSPKGSGSTITYSLVASTTGTSVTLDVGAQIASHAYVVASVSPTGVVSPYSAIVSAEVQYGVSVSGLLVGGGYQDYPSIQAGHTLTASIVAYGNPYPTFAMLSGPSTMSIDPTTGVITYSPSISDFGDYTATFTATNLLNSVTVSYTFHVLGIPTVVVLGGGSFPFDGNTHGATAVAYGSDPNTPLNGTFSFRYNGISTAPYAEAGTWSVFAAFTSNDPNYGGATGTSTIVITPIAPTFTVTGGTYTFDGSPHPAAASAIAINGGAVSGATVITYNGSTDVPTAPGQYNVEAMFTSADRNYTDAAASDVLTIATASAQITPTILINGDPVLYDGTPHAAIATAVAADGVTPVDGTYSITYDGSSTIPADAGVYQVDVAFSSADPNFTDATAGGTLTILPAMPTVVIGDSSFTADGQQHAASAAAVGIDGVTPVDGAFGYTYNGSDVTPSDAGVYTVDASFTSADPNYADTDGTATLTINPGAAAQVIFVQGPTGGMAGSSMSASMTVLDSYGNLVATDNSTVTLTLSNGKFSRGGNTVSAAALNGVATFNNLVIRTAGTYAVTATDGALPSVPSAPFTITPAPNSVNGHVFVDAANTGIPNDSDAGYSNASVTLMPTGTTTGSPVTVATDGDGSYMFTNVNPGTYAVVEALPSGYALTSPTGNATSVTVTAGQAAAGPAFGNISLASVTIGFNTLVTVSQNYNKPGAFAAGDLNGDGMVNFSDLVLLSQNYNHTLPTTAYSLTSTASLTPGLTTSSVTTAAIIATSSTVATTKAVAVPTTLASISGTVYNDINGGGTRQAGETGLGGRTVELQIAGKGTKGQRTTVTNAPGNFSFAGLPAANYIVIVKAPAGWQSTTASDHLSIKAGSKTSGLLFGQQVIPPFTILSKRITDPLDHTKDIVTFYVRNNGYGAAAGTKNVIAIDATLASSSGLFIRTYDVDGSGLLDDADFAGENATPTASYIRVGGPAFVVASTTPSAKTDAYHDMQTVKSFEVAGALLGSGALANAAGGTRIAVAVVAKGAAVSISGQIAAEQGKPVMLTYRDG